MLRAMTAVRTGLHLEADWRPIAPAARVVWGLTGAAVIAAGSSAAAVVAFAAGSTAAALALLALGATMPFWWWWLAGRRWRAWGYAERDADLLLRRGVLVRKLTIVPYGRMQFVDVKQGPLARRMGVASVKLHTAAAASDAEIPMLTEQDAERLRDRLTALGEARAAGL